MEKLLTLALSLLMIMSVCLTGAIAEEGSVVIENNGRTTTYNSVPERVVVLSYSNAETMAALGLEDKVVAAFPGMYTLDDVLPEYQEAVAAMPFITEGLNSGTPNVLARTIMASQELGQFPKQRTKEKSGLLL